MSTVRPRSVGALRREFPGEVVYSIMLGDPGRHAPVLLLEGCLQNLSADQRADLWREVLALLDRYRFIGLSTAPGSMSRALFRTGNGGEEGT